VSGKNRRAHRWGKTKGKIGVHGCKVALAFVARRWAGTAMLEAAGGFRWCKASKQPVIARRRAPLAKKEPLHRTRILAKPPRPRRVSIGGARFALFKIKLDIPPHTHSDGPEFLDKRLHPIFDLYGRAPP
jgi:hypothetical protein